MLGCVEREEARDDSGRLPAQFTALSALLQGIVCCSRICPADTCTSSPGSGQGTLH